MAGNARLTLPKPLGWLPEVLEQLLGKEENLGLESCYES
jgi:hypothetical protein